MWPKPAVLAGVSFPAYRPRPVIRPSFRQACVSYTNCKKILGMQRQDVPPCPKAPSAGHPLRGGLADDMDSEMNGDSEDCRENVPLDILRVIG